MKVGRMVVGGATASHIPGALLALFAAALLPTACTVADRTSESVPRVVIGSKSFTESVVLGELITRLLRSDGVEAEHRGQLGGTRVLWNALLSGEIDIYPEYTGTISEEILAAGALHGREQMRAALQQRGILMSRPLGFNNTYALGMREEEAERLGIRSISDLKDHPQLRFGFSNEFMDRGDGWPNLRDRYRLPQSRVRGLDHDLAYRGIASGSIDVIDLYSTDAEIRLYHLRALTDDLQQFPAYEAVLLYRADLGERAPQAVATLRRLEGEIPEASMIEMNAEAKLERISESRVAADFLARRLGIEAEVVEVSVAARLLRHLVEHLYLVAISLVAAILLAVPLGVLAARRRRLGQLVLGLVGIVQTIPSLALLVIFVPLLGLGALPAIVALFLYSLLPIVRNTYAGLHDVPTPILESAEALGLPPGARLRLIELPMASRAILAGIKTSAVINVGTATLGALIGAGGFGQPILTGIRLADNSLILQGAVPAALLALAAQGLFELAERGLVPKGLRLGS
ncbi:MAG: glycine betaine ABC transporter substrate-binding protein [Acidobacteriota bacterium]